MCLCKTCGDVDRSNFIKKDLSECKLCRKRRCFREYYYRNRDSIIPKLKRYNKENSAAIREYQNKYNVSRRKSDPAFKFTYNLRIRHNKVFKGQLSTIEGLGCTSEELVLYLTSRFTKGMTLDNHGNRKGQWSIDHIIPLSSIELDESGKPDRNSEYNKKLIHYTNLQPMWSEENIQKRDNVCTLASF